jgi:FkbM family methyltransferase
MKTVEQKLIDGSIYTMQLDTEDMINHFDNPNNCTKEILNQFNNLSWYSEYLTKDDKIILDIGGNIGLFALHATPWADKIITVEPTPTHMKLNKHITKNFKNVIHLEAAVSNQNGKIPFYTHGENTTMNSIINRNSNPFMVDCFTIPSIIKKYNLEHVNFIKIDIEGSETIALNEDIVYEMSGIVDKLLIEFHEVNGIEHFENRNIYSKLFVENGYQITFFGPDGLFCYKN